MNRLNEVSVEHIMNKGIKLDEMSVGGMNVEERLFVSGLIRTFKPKKILEVGVAGGEGTVNILSSIQNMDAKVVSIDAVDVFYHEWLGKNIVVGEEVEKHFKEVPKGKWRLLTGKDPSDRLDELKEKFDFVVLDTGHMHPIESLNFISLMPYLTEDCIVVLHDISMYWEDLYKRGGIKYRATRTLFSCMCGEKMIPRIKGHRGYPNIAAVQINSQTELNIRNIFDSLMLPWECYPSFMLKPVANFMRRHYELREWQLFEEALKLNTLISFYQRYMSSHDLSVLLGREITLYGAGNRCKAILEALDKYRINTRITIWDKKAKSINAIKGIPVDEPGNLTLNEQAKVIVTVADDQIYEQVKEKFGSDGCHIYHGIQDFLEQRIAEVISE